MADRRERELLLGIFLMEAWDTAGAIEEGLGLLASAEAPTEAALATLVVFSHRLKGSAALHGFPGVSELAGGTERLLERAPTASTEERSRSVVFLDGLVGLLKEVFDGISAVGMEDSARIARVQVPLSACSSRPRPAAPRPEAGPSAEPIPEPFITAPAPAPAPGSPLTADLRRFFADGGEVLEYFVPEAAEHLEAMTTALLAIEGGARDEDTLATVFRAAHTLKGAAYTVGCAPLGDATHQIEDLLGAVREHRLPVTPAVTEAIFAGTAAIKRVLQSGTAVSDETAQALERATSGPARPGRLGEPARAGASEARGRGPRARRVRRGGPRAARLDGAAGLRPAGVPGPARGAPAAGSPRRERAGRSEHPGAGGAARHPDEPGGRS